jgi:hypothetical protein
MIERTGTVDHNGLRDTEGFDNGVGRNGRERECMR